MRGTFEASRITLPVITSQTAQGIDYELYLDCVHCGLCTSACPTYVELGNENDSPRGRIYLMRAVTDGRIPLDDQVRYHLDLCLDCRACESACPSGVQYGRLIEPFRMHMAKTPSAPTPGTCGEVGEGAPGSPSMSWLTRRLLFGITPYARRMRWALVPARLMQMLRLDRLLEKTGLLRLLPRSLRQMHAMLPRLRPHYGKLPEVLPAEGPKRARVALFTGCAADAFFPDTNVATARVLQKNGCEVWIPRNQGCCGALHYHAAQEEPARQFAWRNLEAFGAQLKDVDAIIVNAAGCGAMLKDYGHLLPGPVADAPGSSFPAKVKDISEFLMDLGPVKPTHPVARKAVYHDACHLCHGQQIRKQPRQLLSLIPELQLLPLSETEICCGAAGSYNLTQPEMAERLGQRKVRNILETGADTVFTGNVGCVLQIARYVRQVRPDMWVAHPIDALWRSYGG
jgi:glycolate oxidase iron-sulfur subunit